MLSRVLIGVFILAAASLFVWLTAGSDPETLLFEHLMVSGREHTGIVLLLCALILVSALAGLPVFYLSMALGFLLPFTPACLISWSVSLAAVLAVFFMVRFAFTGYFISRYGNRKLIKRINRRIRKYGWWTVVFSRAVYIIPTNVINFSFPLSQISFRSYLAGTALGLVPECLLNVLTGYLVRHGVFLLNSPDSRTWQVVVTGGFVLLFALVFFIFRIRYRKRELRASRTVPYGK